MKTINTQNLGFGNNDSMLIAIPQGNTDSSIKVCNNYGNYEEHQMATIEYNEMRSFQQALCSFGLNAKEAADAIHKVSELLSRLSCIENETYMTKDKVEYLMAQCQYQEDALASQTAAISLELRDLRSAMDEKADKPKQKDDLEILNQIVSDKDFFILKDNIFLN